MNEPTKQRFRANPAQFLDECIKAYVRTSPLNRLEAFADAPIFDEPLVGFADGADALFQEYKTIIGDFHLTPLQALGQHLEAIPEINPQEVSTASVISWVLPIHKDTRLSNRRETRGPSVHWNHTRWHGQPFIFELSRFVISVLQEMGHHAVAPEMSASFQMRELRDGLTSTWSQRHIAYAAGLGTFGLSDGFITPRGVAMRCGSVVTDLKLPPTPRPYSNHLANCLFYADGSCRRCRERCPGGAITERGHDKKKCFTTLFLEQKPWIDGAHGEGYIGAYAGCGLCQTKTPCEDRIPPRKRHGTTSA
ncbi:MAG: epoxyqueuosine reductase [Dehalococcoidia bacterium]